PARGRARTRSERGAGESSRSGADATGARRCGEGRGGLAADPRRRAAGSAAVRREGDDRSRDRVPAGDSGRAGGVVVHRAPPRVAYPYVLDILIGLPFLIDTA